MDDRAKIENLQNWKQGPAWYTGKHYKILQKPALKVQLRA